MVTCHGPTMRCVAAACLLLTFGCLCVFAQQDAGGLLVSVRDPKGAVVPDARVAVTNVDTNQTTEGITIEAGDFTASPLRPGRYRATVKREGFQTAISEVVSVGAQQTPRVEITLVVGSVSESVTVLASATLLQTADVSKSSRFPDL